MYATIRRWGNSQGLRIPKALLDAVNIHENDRVKLEQTKDAITIKKNIVPTHKTLEERLVSFYGKPVNEITEVEKSSEVDWGKSEGSEVW